MIGFFVAVVLLDFSVISYMDKSSKEMNVEWFDAHTYQWHPTNFAMQNMMIVTLTNSSKEMNVEW